MNERPARSARLPLGARLYSLYVGLFNALFWMPVFFLYFDALLPIEDVLRLEALYYVAVVVLELPSGYLSDRVGRRLTLLLSALSLVGAYALFALGGSFGVLAAAQLLLAGGIAFASGTDTAFHYDALAEVGRQAEYGPREARAARNAFAAGAVAALVGGWAGSFDLRLAYALSWVVAAGMVVLLLLFREPRRAAGSPVAERPLAQLAAVVGDARSARLRWLFAWAVAMVVLNHVPYELYQPYLELLRAEGRTPGTTGTPLLAGLHLFATQALGVVAAAGSMRVARRWGVPRTLLAGTTLQVALIALLGLTLHPWVAVVAIARGVPRALTTAPLNAAVTPRVPRERRATYLSLQSLAGRLSFALVLGLLSSRVGHTTDWPALSAMARAAAALGMLMLAALWLARPRSDGPDPR